MKLTEFSVLYLNFFFSLLKKFPRTREEFFHDYVLVPRPNNFQSLSFAPSARLCFGLVFTLCDLF
jgi:hypothetical protein